jgi:hypothetical protein
MAGRQASYLQLPVQAKVLILLVLRAVLPVAGAQAPAAPSAAPQAGVARCAVALAAALLAVLHKLALQAGALLGQSLAALVADGLAKLEVLKKGGAVVVR